MNKKLIKEHQEVNVFSVLDTDLDTAICTLQALRRTAGCSAMLYYDIAEQYDDYFVDLTLTWERPETDAEYDKRILEAQKRSESAKKSAAERKVTLAKEERILYERLKEKYENGTA